MSKPIQNTKPKDNKAQNQRNLHLEEINRNRPDNQKLTEERYWELYNQGAFITY